MTTLTMAKCICYIVCLCEILKNNKTEYKCETQKYYIYFNAMRRS